MKSFLCALVVCSLSIGQASGAGSWLQVPSSNPSFTQNSLNPVVQPADIDSREVSRESSFTRGFHAVVSASQASPGRLASIYRSTSKIIKTNP
jgi:hypothetical protein